MSFQDVTRQREVLVLARDEQDVLEGLRGEHLVIQQLGQFLQGVFRRFRRCKHCHVVEGHGVGATFQLDHWHLLRDLLGRLSITLVVQDGGLQVKGLNYRRFS